MPGRVVGCAVLPAVPDHERPGASEDADGVAVFVAAGGLAGRGRLPRAGVPAVAMREGTILEVRLGPSATGNVLLLNGAQLRLAVLGCISAPSADPG